MNLFWRACEVLSVAQGDPCFLSPTRPRKPMGHPSEYGAAEPQGPIPIKITGLVHTQVRGLYRSKMEAHRSREAAQTPLSVH